ncbi:DUF6114 domain-containing protein [Actinokineospora spheciospongiae]|uniref:DUF6114 domain-containing protein n=1 Tax=Actinokineospora spheciospongiae TaxID=909613 RepID=UPI000D713D68|nr:DUF6114 domain-containing protein [Actinokineospora spheciospongiae]PWW63359.1 hypothetical protein DFQ13_104349 [Actinokineospora spheciospongiae]
MLLTGAWTPTLAGLRPAARRWAAAAGGQRRVFARWRRGRPFRAGVFLLLSAVAIAVPPYATFRLGDAVISIRTLGGVSALLIGALMAICGLSLWVRPQYRIAAGTTAALLSLVALVTSNLGGFLVGTLSGLIGSALALAWTDRPRAGQGAAGQRWWRSVPGAPGEH